MKKILTVLAVILLAWQGHGYAAEQILLQEDFSKSCDMIGYDGKISINFGAGISEYPLGDSWKVHIPSGYNSYGTSYEIAQSKLQIFHRWGAADRIAIVEPGGEYAPGDAYTLSFRMGYNTYQNTAVSNWSLNSTIFARFNLSTDQQSFYEIGMTGSGDALADYPLGTEDTSADYQYRLYFRKVVNGEQVYVDFDDPGEQGLFEQMATLNGATYWRWSGFSMANHRMGLVEIQRSGNTIQWSVGGEGLLNGVFDWRGSYTDTEPILAGTTPVQFGAAGHETGITIDDVLLCVPAEDTGEANAEPTMEISQVSKYYKLKFSGLDALGIESAQAIITYYADGRLIGIQTKTFNPQTTGSVVLLQNHTLGVKTRVGVYTNTLQPIIPMHDMVL